MARKLKPVHPGEILRKEYLKPHGLSMNRLSSDLRVPATRIAEIVAGRRGITSDMALRLARDLGTTAGFWMNLQVNHETKIAESQRKALIDRDVRLKSVAA